MFRNEPPEEVVSLYRAADALLVTPLRDGMNLVAKEFVACRSDEEGVLVLSEFAGAATELAEAVHVNPYDIEGMAEAFHRVLIMTAEERRSRMQALRRRVLSSDLARWSQGMLGALTESNGIRALPSHAADVTRMPSLLQRARCARPLVLLLDSESRTLAGWPADPSARGAWPVVPTGGRRGPCSADTTAELARAGPRTVPSERRGRWWKRSRRDWPGITVPSIPKRAFTGPVSCGGASRSCFAPRFTAMRQKTMARLQSTRSPTPAICPSLNPGGGGAERSVSSGFRGRSPAISPP
jgi:hypothetical protein